MLGFKTTGRDTDTLTFFKLYSKAGRSNLPRITKPNHREPILKFEKGFERLTTKLGDVGPNFFHVNAPVRHRKNLISHLETSYGTFIADNNMKSNIHWSSFRERFGMPFDLDSLLQNSLDISFLTDPFLRGGNI